MPTSKSNRKGASSAIPSAPGHERHTVGTFMAEPSKAAERFESVPRHYIYDCRHELMHDAVGALLKSDRAPTTIAVRQWLSDHGQLHAAGGDAYLSKVVEKALPEVFTENVRELAKKAAQRQCLMIMGDLQRFANDGEADAHAIDDVRAAFESIVSGRKRRRSGSESYKA